jgi:curved DNA-binding protein CbpA
MTGGPQSASRRSPASARGPIPASAEPEPEDSAGAGNKAGAGAGAEVTAVTAGPFLALGLQARPDLTDDDIRGAWRRIAAATHPDRADGGDPERFAAAAAAYTALRTRFGRGEALADLRAAAAAPAGRRGARSRRGTGTASLRAARSRRRAAPAGLAGRLAFRVRHGRPWRLALRALAAVGASAAAAIAAGPQPATPALITGAVTWLALTARHDLAPPADRRPPAARPGKSRRSADPRRRSWSGYLRPVRTGRGSAAARSDRRKSGIRAVR